MAGRRKRNMNKQKILCHPVTRVKHDAIIYWTDVSNGGKLRLPDGTAPYYVICEPFNDCLFDADVWSVVLEIESNFIEEGSRTALGQVYFLVEAAPDYLLQQGFVMKVYEGNRYVASVEIL